MTKSIKATDIVAQLEALQKKITEQDKVISELKKQKTPKKSGSKPQNSTKRPYSDRHEVLSNLDIEYKKQFMSKADFEKLSKVDIKKRSPFPMNKKHFIKVFQDHNLGGNAWISYSLQLDNFIVPLKTHYKVSKKQWDAYKKNLIKYLKANRDKTMGKIKEGKDDKGEELSQSTVKTLGYQAQTLSQTITKIEML